MVDIIIEIAVATVNISSSNCNDDANNDDTEAAAAAAQRQQPLQHNSDKLPLCVPPLLPAVAYHRC